MPPAMVEPPSPSYPSFSFSADAVGNVETNKDAGAGADVTAYVDASAPGVYASLVTDEAKDLINDVMQ